MCGRFFSFLSLLDEKRDLHTYLAGLLNSSSQDFLSFSGTAGCGSFSSESLGPLVGLHRILVLLETKVFPQFVENAVGSH